MQGSGSTIRKIVTGVCAVGCLAVIPTIAPATTAAAAAASKAGPGTLVYLKGDRVYVARTDGSAAHPVTSPSQWWAWPSESANGVIAVAGGKERVNPGGTTESSGSSEVYAFTQLGKSLLSTPVQTPGSVSGPTAPTYVNHFRISPNGGSVAYDVLGCCGASGASTFVSPMVAGSSGWRDFQDDYIDPQWVDGLHDPNVDVANALALSHNGIPIWGNDDYAVYNAANQDSGDGRGWVNDTAIPDGWDYQAFFSPDLAILGLFLDDASNYVDSTPRHVEIKFERLSYDGTNTDLCGFSLPASAFKSTAALLEASPTISPDGSTLAWAQDDGVYEMNISSQNDCNAMAKSAHRVVAGGSMPSFSSASLITAHPVASISASKRVRAKHSIRLSGAPSHERGGAIVSYHWRFGDGTTGAGVHTRHTYRHRGHFKVTLTVSDRIGRTAKTTKWLTVTR